MRDIVSLVMGLSVAIYMLGPDLRWKVLEATHGAFAAKYKKFVTTPIDITPNDEWKWLYEPVPEDKLASSLKPD